ncbi:hypothetical protein [Streptomyces violaceusniger]|uniref:hypothetical protein n=1 Tax=Streptomyces violaceusniger TaxID=68280 RepID=UPI0036B1DE81
MSHTIEPGQVYAACDESGYRYQVLDHAPDAAIIPVVDTKTGGCKQIKRHNLHPTAFKDDGTPRYSGYALERG